MSNNCCAPQFIQMPLPVEGECGPYTVLPNACANPWCERPADQEHHAVRKAYTRSWWTRDWALLHDHLAPIKIPLCLICHNRCTDNQATVRYDFGNFFWDNGDGTAWRTLKEYEIEPLEDDEGAPNQGGSDGPGNPITPSSSSSGPEAYPSEAVPPEEADGPLNPGQMCPLCERKIPHPRKPSSPKSKVVGHRMPMDMAEDFKEIVNATAVHLGCDSEPYAGPKAILTALTYVLTMEPDEVWSEIGERVA